MKVRKWLLLPGTHRYCQKCSLCVEFSGEAPANPSETLVHGAAGGKQAVSLHWLEERIADALYNAEVGRGGSANDVGLWGPAVFREESARVLAEMRPSFGVIKENGSSGHHQETK